MGIKHVLKKLREKYRDCKYIFKHSNYLRGMIAQKESILYSRDEEDKNLILIAFYPTGGFGDSIISSKLLDELMLYGPCRIDVFCNNMVFGKAVFGQRPGVKVLPYDAYENSKYLYDIALTVEHFIHVDHYNPRHVAKLSSVLADKMVELGKSMGYARPDIIQQYYREAIHFRRCELKGINRYTELNHGKVFSINDRRTAVYLDMNYQKRLEELGIAGKKYITLNRGADSMGRSTMQTKVWPLKYYEKFVKLFKQQYPDIYIYQLGDKTNTKIAGIDKYILGESLEVVKWILKYSKLHLDCEGGLVHLGSQLSTKCAVIFGPTPYHLYAYPQNINIVSDKCSNCMGMHQDWAFSCIRGLSEPECTYSITPEIVMEKIHNHMTLTTDKMVSMVTFDEEEDAKNTLDENINLEIYGKINNNQLINIDNKIATYYKLVVNKIDSLHKTGKNIAVLNAGREILPWYLVKKGYQVTIIDECFGWSGNQSDISHCLYMQMCNANGIEVRYGNEYCIPYEESAFDGIIVLKGEFNSKSDIKRVVKEKGFILLVN